MNKQSNIQLSMQVLRKFRILFGSVRQQFREVEHSCGVTGSQLWILHEVAKRQGLGVSGLAERLSIHQSTCSQLVDKLVERGLINKERSKDDQRRVGLSLTKEAEKILENAPGPAEGILPLALSALSVSTLMTLDNSLVEVINQLHIRDDKYADKPLSDL